MNYNFSFCPKTKIFYPSFNSSITNDDSVLFEHLKTRLQVVQNGEVMWLGRREITVGCDMNLKYFPFDTQVCHLEFGSWWHHSEEIDFKINNDKVNTRK